MADADETDAVDRSDAPERSARAEALWSETRISVVELALPGGVGYTLRAYRDSSELTAPDIDQPTAEELDDFDAASAAVVRRRRADGDDADDADVDESDANDVDADEDAADEEPDADDETDEDEESDEDEANEPEEVPVFLGGRGRLFVFRSPDKLVEFVTSDAEHDLRQLDTWSDLTSRITPDDVVALPEDTYELDLVVENLRGGSDAWDPPLIIKAGEVARDIAYALRIESVQAALSSGSPLDDLDEALRAAESGAVSAFFARRRLRKIPAQQSALGWRTIIGKISTVTQWQD